MKRTIKAVALIVMMLIINGCVGLDVVNSNNAAKLAVANSNNAAQMEIARINANAELQAQFYRSNADILQAQASAMAQTSIHSIWASQIPLVVILLSLTILIGIILYFRGQLALKREEVYYGQVAVLPYQPTKVLPTYDFEAEIIEDVQFTPKEMKALKDVAKQYNAELILNGNQPQMRLPNGKMKMLTVNYD